MFAFLYERDRSGKGLDPFQQGLGQRPKVFFAPLDQEAFSRFLRKCAWGRTLAVGFLGGFGQGIPQHNAGQKVRVTILTHINKYW